MGEKALYRSALRSRRLIREATVALLGEKPLDRITVTDVVKRADLNRSTFYAHYADVRAVIEEFENDSIERLFDVLGEIDYDTFFQDPEPVLKKVNRYLEQDIGFFRALMLSDNADGFQKKLTDIYIRYMRSDSGIPEKIRNSPFFEMQMCFFADGAIGVSRRWLTGELKGSIDEITTELSRIMKLAADGFAALYNEK